MIIVDLNQTMISNIMMQINVNETNSIDIDMLRHMVLNAIRAYKQKFSAEYGELVIACDTTNYWRRQLFPYYKASRRAQMDKSNLDWSGIFNALNQIRKEIKEFFPYRVIEVDQAEADDIIATLVNKYANNEKIMILSGDKDFVQLQRFPNVSQYDPVRKRELSTLNPQQFLLEHIFKGDAGDGIPNVLSAANSFVNKVRQKPITTKRLAAWCGFNGMPSAEFAELCNNDPTIKYNYERNKTLIDLSFVPTDLSDQIISEYHGQGGKDRSKLLNYFIDNKLRHLMENLSDF